MVLMDDLGEMSTTGAAGLTTTGNEPTTDATSSASALNILNGCYLCFFLSLMLI
jgi:hypothetical protein